MPYHVLGYTPGLTIITSETFTGANGSPPDARYWTVQERTGATMSSNTCDIQSNQLTAQFTATHNGGSQHAGYFIDTNFYLHGDFDFQVDVAYPTGTATNKILGMNVLSYGGLSLFAYQNFEGVGPRIAWWFPSNSSTLTSTATKLRYIRTGTVLTGQYFDGSWITASSYDFGSAPSTKIRLNPHTFHSDGTPGSGTFVGSYDNVVISADTLSWEA